MPPLTVRARRVVNDYIGDRRDFDGQNELTTISGSISGYSLYDGHPQNPRVSLIAEWWNTDLCLIQRDQRQNPITRYLIRLLEDVGISWQYASTDGEPDGRNPEPAPVADPEAERMPYDPTPDPEIFMHHDQCTCPDCRGEAPDPEPTIFAIDFGSDPAKVVVMPQDRLATEARRTSSLLTEERDRIMRRARHAKAHRYGIGATDSDGVITALVEQARRINRRAIDESRRAAAN